MTPETLAKEILHGIEKPFQILAKAERVIETAIQHQPELKDAVKTLVAKCDAIGVDAMEAIGTNGLNLSEDLATAIAIAELGKFLGNTFIPLVEKLYGEIKADVTVEGAV